MIYYCCLFLCCRAWTWKENEDEIEKGEQASEKKQERCKKNLLRDALYQGRRTRDTMDAEGEKGDLEKRARSTLVCVAWLRVTHGSSSRSRRGGGAREGRRSKCKQDQQEFLRA